MSQPKIVIWDLETLPDPKKVYKVLPSLGNWPGRSFKAQLHTIISFGYKLYGDKEAKCVNAWDFKEHWKNDRQDDSALVQYIYDMLHDADEIVTHNGKRFDLKVINTRLAFYGMPPLASDIKHVDTKVSLKKISLYSNSLAEAAKFFQVDEKMSFSNKWGLWERIAFKEETKEDLKLMDLYCKQDVDTLEQIYEKLKPYQGNSGVNHGLFNDNRGSCPNCGSTKLHGHGFKTTRSKKVKRYLCQDCGSVSTGNTKGELK